MPTALAPSPIQAIHRRQALQWMAAALALPRAGAAWALDVPKGKVVLSLSGAISLRNAATQADFDMDMLAALPQQTFSTHTPWFKEARKFTGPLLRDVLSAAGASGKTLTAVALNDYRVSIPTEDAIKYPLIVARLLDDQTMTVREKGPLFIIYPFDSHTELRNERYYNRSAWQLRALEVR